MTRKALIQIGRREELDLIFEQLGVDVKDRRYPLEITPKHFGQARKALASKERIEDLVGRQDWEADWEGTEKRAILANARAKRSIWLERHTARIAFINSLYGAWLDETSTETRERLRKEEENAESPE